jgi:Transcription factor WhiB
MAASILRHPSFRHPPLAQGRGGGASDLSPVGRRGKPSKLTCPSATPVLPSAHRDPLPLAHASLWSTSVVVATTASDVDMPMLVALAMLFGADDFASQTWRRRASCRGADPEVFAIARGQSPEAAFAYCRRCDVAASTVPNACSLRPPENIDAPYRGGA